MTSPGRRLTQSNLRQVERMTRNLPTNEPGTKLLVAVDGFSEPGKECGAGDMLWPTAWCGTPGCTCGDTFHGMNTHGTVSVGRVQIARGAPRVLFETAITAQMRGHEGFEDPDRAAAAFLDELAGIDEGRLVRREENVLFPFPLEARITGPHHIEYPVDSEP